ncbi:MAG: AlpA family phage regulatory protein [Methylococcales bacterium]
MATTTVIQDLPKLKPQYLSTAHQLPQQGFVRICQIVGSKSKGIPAILPIGRTSFLNGVKSGKYPKPVKLGERTTAWRVEDIRALIVSLGA